MHLLHFFHFCTCIVSVEVDVLPVDIETVQRRDAKKKVSVKIKEEVRNRNGENNKKCKLVNQQVPFRDFYLETIVWGTELVIKCRHNTFNWKITQFNVN